MMMPSITAIPNSAMKPIAADTLNGIPDIRSPSAPPKIAIGITLMASRVSTIEPKLNHSSTAISARLIGTTIDSRLMASCRLPNSPTHSTHPRPRRELDFRGDLLLRLPDRAAEIAFAHRELDRQIAFLLLPIDIGRARDQPDRSNLAERYLRDSAVRACRADAQILDRFRAFAIFRRQANDDREMPVAAGFIEIARGIAADRHLDRGVDIAGGETVAGRLGPVDIDLDGRLAERSKHRQVGDPLHGSEDGLDLVGAIGERLQIVAVQFDRVLALYARDGFGNVVLKVLREIELDARKLLLQLRQHPSRQLILVVTIRPLADRLQRGKE